MPAALDDGDLAGAAGGGGSVRGAVKALAQVHQCEEGGQDALLEFVGEAQPAVGDDGELIGGGLYPVGNFGLARRSGFAQRDFTAEFGTVVFDRGEEVLDAQHFGFELLWDWKLAPA